MKRNIIVEIDCENEQCGECMGPDGHGSCGLRAWEREGNLPATFTQDRGPVCLAAEKKLQDLVAAGNRIKRQLSFAERNYGASGDPVPCWDAALAAISAKP